MQGLAPSFFNFAPTLYVRDGGRVAGRIEGSYDLYFTQRVVRQNSIGITYCRHAPPSFEFAAPSIFESLTPRRNVKNRSLVDRWT
jgi:copper resistance protein B